jgi:2-oxoglutarate dehydrogenase E2 component (dihydrolipoamide succinyltransferase)
MAIVDLVMPKMGESIMEATILKWHKQVGDAIKMDETMLEIATDKVDSEVPSTAAGTITAILFNVNDVVPVGTVIAQISTDAAGASVAAPVAEAAPTPAPQPAPVAPAQHAAAVASSSNADGARFYSPLVLNIAATEHISMAELEQIPGTGNEGRVTKKDILQYVANRSAAPVAAPAPTPAPAVAAAPAASANVTATSIPSGSVEIIEMDRVRKLIADHMVRSKATSPHVTSFTEADVTNIVKWRDANKAKFEKQYGEKITFTPIFIEAIANCIRKFPMINVSVDGNNIIESHHIKDASKTSLH